MSSRHLQNPFDRLLFNNNCEESEDDDRHHKNSSIKQLNSDIQDLLDDDQQYATHDYLDQVTGRQVASDSFLKNRGDKTERQYHIQQESKIRFAQVTAASVEFSHSEFNLSKLGDRKSPIKPSAINYEEQLRKKEVEFRMERNKREEQDDRVDEALNMELTVMADQIRMQTKQIAEKDALIRGYRKKIESLEDDTIQLNDQLVARHDKQLQLSKKLDDAVESNLKKDQVFNELSQQMENTVERLGQKQSLIDSLQAQIKSLREQFELFNLSNKNCRDLNIDRPNKQRILDEVASKRSLTLVYDQTSQLKKQYSTKTLLTEHDSGTQLKQQNRQTDQLKRQKEQLERELVRLKEKFILCQQGFLSTKHDSDRLQVANQELERCNTNMHADLNRMQNELTKKESYIAQLSKTLSQRMEKNNRDSKDLTKQYSNLHQTNNDMKDRVNEYEKRLKLQNDQLQKKQLRIKDLMVEITTKSKAITDNNKLITELRNGLQLQGQKIQESEKEIKVLSNQLKEHREKTKSLQRMVEDKNKGKKEQDRIQQLKKDVIRLEKEAQERETQFKQSKKKLDEANKKYAISRSKIVEIQQQLNNTKAELAADKQSYKKLTVNLNQMKKKTAQTELLYNKVKILQMRFMEKENNNHIQGKDTFDLNDKIEALEEILKVRDREIEQLKEILEQIHQEHSSEHMMLRRSFTHTNTDNQEYPKTVQSGYERNSRVNGDEQQQIENLIEQLEEKDIIIGNYRREVETREKSLEFLQHKLLKVEREKLEMQSEAKIFNSNIYESTDSQYMSENEVDSYNTKPTLRKDKVELYETKIKSLQQRNKILEDRLNEQIADKKKSTTSRYTNNKQSNNTLKDVIRDSCSNKIEVLVLKNRVKQLTQMLNKVYNESNTRKLPPESLSPNETLEFLFETMRRVSKSAEMIKLLNKSSEFMELIRSIDKRKDEMKYTRRLYV